MNLERTQIIQEGASKTEGVSYTLLKHMAVKFREFTRALGAVNLFDEGEVVLWTKVLELDKKYTIIADTGEKGFFVAVLKGNSLPSADDLYNGGHTIIQLDPGNFPKKFLSFDNSRIPIVGRIIIMDRDLGLDETFDLLKEMYEVANSRGFIDNSTGVLRKLEDTPYFIPR